MQSIVIHQAKDLRLQAGKPESPAAGQVLIELATGGICGSDLHYYNHGGFGSVRLREPMILGHEVAGYVRELGPQVEFLSEGTLVAVSPSRPCRRCNQCSKGLLNHCDHMRFYGSAMPFPHIQGAFRQWLVADADQCVIADGLSPDLAALAEPFSVCLHAARRAGEILGKKVLITGSGPIGALCIVAARSAGAAEIVVTDVADAPLTYARKMGADRTINIIDEPNALEDFHADKGHFDIHFECSGVAAALASAIACLKPRGVILQLGLGGDMTVPVQALTAKELDLRGSFRFHEEFAIAVQMMRNRQVDIAPLISHTFPMENAVEAFELASDRLKSMKVQLDFLSGR